MTHDFGATISDYRDWLTGGDAELDGGPDHRGIHTATSPQIRHFLAGMSLL